MTLEAEAHAEAERARAEGRDHPGEPDERAQRKLTDPDSRIMPGTGRPGLSAVLQLPGGGEQRA